MCPTSDIIDYAVEVIRSGGIIVAPTDTVYGIIADPYNEEAVNKVFQVKKRSRDKPLPILLGESHHAFHIVRPSERFWKLAIRFWPGPLTIVEKPVERVPQHLAVWGNLGVRLPHCPFIREVARRIGGLLIGTSANKSGMIPPTTAYEAHAQLGNSIDLYIDGGPSLRSAPSTVVDVTGEEPLILRDGAIPGEKIIRVLQE